jgi:hypothetical protein
MIKKIVGFTSLGCMGCFGILGLFAGLLLVALLIIKLVWTWTVPDLFPGAVEQGLIAESLTGGPRSSRPSWWRYWGRSRASDAALDPNARRACLWRDSIVAASPDQGLSIRASEDPASTVLILSCPMLSG